MTIKQLRHEFIDAAPAEFEAGVLYVSIEFRTTFHSCCCGCGNVVVLPLRPTAWRFTYDGVAISMSPSVGNWSFPCRSHYWIRDGRVKWAEAWTDEEIALGRQRTLIERGAGGAVSRAASQGPSAEGWIGRLRRWLRIRQRQ